MQINAFRIRNFRSILDTGWVPLSLDNVTALVGQNESGKSAVLDALAVTFSASSVTTDDQRHGEPLPIIDLRVTHSPQELERALGKVADEDLRASIWVVFKDRQYRAEWNFETCPDPDDRTQLSVSYELAEPSLAGLIEMEIAALQQVAEESHIEEEQRSVPTGQAATAVSAPRPSTPGTAPTSASAPVASAVPPKALAAKICDSFRDALFQASPTIIAFDEQSGLLPDRADITKEFKLAGPGAQAARNFLYIAGMDLQQLVESDTRARATILKKANRKVTAEFLAFWRQTIGKQSSLELECSIHHYPAGNEKVGETYLEFLIIDSATPLYPKQRSRGTRWFISFFLQLQASAVQGRNRIFLLDEPGSNLHERAQADVLDLIEKIRPSIGIIYSTTAPT